MSEQTPKEKQQENNFIYHVQRHERAWGNENYTNRPDLADILAAQVVVFWQHAGEDTRWTITLHKSLDEVEAYLARLFLRLNINMPNKRIARIFENGRRIIIKGVRVKFEPAPD